MTSHVGLEAGELFAAASREYRKVSGLQRAMEDQVAIEVTNRVLAAVRVAKPRAKAFPEPKNPDQPYYAGARCEAALVWAKNYIDVDAFLQSACLDLTGSLAERATRQKNARERMAQLGLMAVFPKVTELFVLYENSGHTTQGAPSYYQQVACQLRAALLSARGFTPTVEGTPRGFRVVANAPIEVTDVLPFWRLDDTRLLAVVGAANLKVLFHPTFPYTGPWDWPESKRERREDPSFASHRKNEDAHIQVNCP
jgi:hypothetical protein